MARGNKLVRCWGCKDESGLVFMAMAECVVWVWSISGWEVITEVVTEVTVCCVVKHIVGSMKFTGGGVSEFLKALYHNVAVQVLICFQLRQNFWLLVGVTVFRLAANIVEQ